MNSLSDPKPQPDVDTTSWAVRWYLAGSFTDEYKFEATIDTTKQGYGSVTGGGEIIFDDNYNIVSLKVMGHHEKNGTKSTWGMDCGKLISNYSDPYYLSFRADKNEACQTVQQITGYYEDAGYSDLTTGFLCDDRSYVFVKFTID